MVGVLGDSWLLNIDTSDVTQLGHLVHKLKSGRGVLRKHSAEFSGMGNLLWGFCGGSLAKHPYELFDVELSSICGILGSW